MRNYGLGSYYNPKQNSESCRYICTYHPLCKSYLFLAIASSCILLSTEKWTKDFEEFTNRLKKNEAFPKNLEYNFLSSTHTAVNMHDENLDELEDIQSSHSIQDCYDNYKYSICHGELEGSFDLNANFYF